ncbi:MAG: sulfatase-like hydrolase/transferase [Phycisphaerae bacterium]
MASRRIGRRGLLKAAAGGATIAALGPRVLPARAVGKAGGKPNILFIMSDEHNASVTGCYGNALVRTPHMDRLAARGVTFDAAYCNSPLCVPSRLAFTAGKYVSRTGAWSNACWLPSADYPSIAGVMSRAGYEALLCGKMHYDATRRYGFHEIGGNMNRSRKTGKGGRRKADDLVPKGGISARFKDFHPGESSILRHDRAVTAGTVELLGQRKRGDKPFLLAAGYLAPHFPLIVPEEYWQPYKGKVAMPKIPPGHLESQVRNWKHLRIGFNVEDAPADIVRKGRELYYGLTQWLDEEIGKVLKALADSEVADDTVVIYTTDHGENMGEHGLWWKNCMYEHAARVPLIVSWPKRWQAGQRRAEACSIVDVVRTIAELGGGRCGDDWNGDSMVGWLDDPKAAWKDLAVSEYYAHNICSGCAMIRTGGHKYVYHSRPDEGHPPERELYDLRADPGEFSNLASRDEHKRRVERMHAALVKEIGEDPETTERRCREEYARGYGRKDAAAGGGGKRKGRGQ